MEIVFMIMLGIWCLYCLLNIINNFVIICINKIVIVWDYSGYVCVSIFERVCIWSVWLLFIYVGVGLMLFWVKFIIFVLWKWFW